MRLITTLALVLATGCSCKNPFSQPQPDVDHVEVMALTGGCNNEYLDGTCTFLLMHAMSSDYNSGPAGTTVFGITYTVEAGERKVEIDSTYLRIPDGREDDLRSHLLKTSPVACKAYIVRPPCNPQATSVTPEVAYPDYATEVRF